MSGPRYPGILPENLTDEQKVFHYEYVDKIKNKGFGSRFTLIGNEGQLLGPLSIMTYTPVYSRTIMQLNAEVLALPGLEPNIKELAVFATQAHYTGSFGGFLIYSHSRIAPHTTTLSKHQMQLISEGTKPDDLGEKESVAYDLCNRIVKGGKPLEEELWQKANEVLGKTQTLSVIHVVAMYSLHGVLLNTGIIGAPDGESIW